MRTTLVALTLLAASLLHAQDDERTMWWKSIDVTAKLENDGTLRVSERQRIVFDGAWNGGERRFLVDPGQQLVLDGISSVNAKGTRFPLVEARGEGIGFREYRFDGETLRWRARNPDDPPFRNATRTYVIEYALRNVVERNGDSYNLAHDFGLPAAPWPIESFSVKLELDSGWQAPPDFVPRFERTSIAPGESGVPLTLQMKWVGEGQPRYVTVAAPPPPVQTGPPTYMKPQPPPVPPPPPASMLSKLIAFGAFALVGMLLLLHLLRREEALGRYEPPPQVTPQWLEENLLVHRAEVVGAAWDGTTGAGEVAALLAIMTSEGKIENVPGAPRLRLLVPRETLSEYERGFVDALFINGNEIDPATLRHYYRYTGFDPSRTIAGPLAAAAHALVGERSRGSVVLGCLAGLACLFLSPVMVVAFALTLPFALSYRNSLLGRRFAMFLPLPIVLSAALHVLVLDSLGWLLGGLLAGIVLLWAALRTASWRETDFELRNLRNFRAARAFLRECIRRRDPVVDPRWIPYMLAFGLLPDDRWTVAAVRQPLEPQPRYYDGDLWASTSVTGLAGGGAGVPSATSAPVPPFQAGGGRFGGAGATGSWASIQSFAAAVAASPPRSTISGSSGSSGSGWNWSSSGSRSSSSSSRSSSSSSRSSSSSSSSGSSGGSSSRSSGSRSGGGGGGGW